MYIYRYFQTDIWKTYGRQKMHPLLNIPSHRAVLFMMLMVSCQKIQLQHKHLIILQKQMQPSGNYCWWFTSGVYLHASNKLSQRTRFKCAPSDTSDSKLSRCQKFFYLNWVIEYHLPQTHAPNHNSHGGSRNPSFQANTFQTRQSNHFGN